jgi:hypothetical protein
MKEIKEGALCTVRFVEGGLYTEEIGVVMAELKRVRPFDESRYDVFVVRLKKNMKFPRRYLHMME